MESTQCWTRSGMLVLSKLYSEPGLRNETFLASQLFKVLFVGRDVGTILWEEVL